MLKSGTWKTLLCWGLISGFFGPHVEAKKSESSPLPFNASLTQLAFKATVKGSYPIGLWLRGQAFREDWGQNQALQQLQYRLRMAQMELADVVVVNILRQRSDRLGFEYGITLLSRPHSQRLELEANETYLETLGEVSTMTALLARRGQSFAELALNQLDRDFKGLDILGTGRPQPNFQQLQRYTPLSPLLDVFRRSLIEHRANAQDFGLYLQVDLRAAPSQRANEFHTPRLYLPIHGGRRLAEMIGLGSARAAKARCRHHLEADDDPNV